MANPLSDISQRTAQLKKHPHCSNCGGIQPPMLEWTGMEQESHTQCCHEAVCKGLNDYPFIGEEVTVEACCWAMAELQFALKGIDIFKLKSIRRYTYEEGE